MATLRRSPHIAPDRFAQGVETPREASPIAQEGGQHGLDQGDQAQQERDSPPALVLVWVSISAFVEPLPCPASLMQRVGQKGGAGAPAPQGGVVARLIAGESLSIGLDPICRPGPRIAGAMPRLPPFHQRQRRAVPP